MHPNGVPGVALKVPLSLLPALQLNQTDGLHCTARINVPKFCQRVFLCCLQVVSDIDDTLMCSGGSYPAGRDTRYPHNCVYPGILAFYNELDVGHVQRSEIQVCLETGARARMLRGFVCHGMGLVVTGAMPTVIVKGPAQA